MQISLLWPIFFRRRPPLSNSHEIRNANLVLGLSFGLPDNVCSNVEMGEIAAMLHREFHRPLPLLLQWEIANAVEDAPVELRVEKHREAGKYLDTYEVIAQAAEYWFGQLGKSRTAESRAIILAHPDHTWRCAMTAKKLGFKPVIVLTESVKYPSNSEQRWTRSAWWFRPYDILARLIYWKKGWI